MDIESPHNCIPQGRGRGRARKVVVQRPGRVRSLAEQERKAAKHVPKLGLGTSEPTTASSSDNEVKNGVHEASRNGFNDSSTKETTTEYQNRPDNGNSSKQGITNEDRNADENEQITEHNIIPEASHQNDRLQEDARILNNDKDLGSNENSAENKLLSDPSKLWASFEKLEKEECQNKIEHSQTTESTVHTETNVSQSNDGALPSISESLLDPPSTNSTQESSTPVVPELASCSPTGVSSPEPSTNEGLIHSSSPSSAIHDQEATKLEGVDPILLLLSQSVDVPEFVPKQSSNHAALQYHNEYYDESNVEEQLKANEGVPFQRASRQEEGEYHILDVVRNTVRHLTQCPGEYDFLIGDFTEVLQTMTEKRTMTEFVEILIENAIKESNFQYTAVKMAHLFEQSKCLEINSDVNFRVDFYKRLQVEYRSLKDQLKDRTNAEKLSRATGQCMFFGDLLCNMKKGDSLNIVFLRAVFGIIKILLEDPCEKTISCLIKLLKLTGPTLDEHKVEENLDQVDETFDKIRDLSLNKNWLANIESGELLKNRLFSVYKLHTRNWDAGVRGEEKGKLYTALPFEVKDESDTSDSTIDWNEYYVGDDDEEDNDIDDAYEQFLRETNQV